MRCLVKVRETESRMAVAGGWGQTGNYCLMGRVSVLQLEQLCGDARWWWLHNITNTLNATSCTLKTVRTAKFVLCVLYRNKKKKIGIKVKWYLIIYLCSLTSRALRLSPSQRRKERNGVVSCIQSHQLLVIIPSKLKWKRQEPAEEKGRNEREASRWWLDTDRSNA